MKSTELIRGSWKWVVLLLLGADIITVLVGQSIAYAFRFRTDVLPAVQPMSSVVPPLMVAVFVAAFSSQGLYRMRFAAGAGLDEYRRVLMAAVGASVVIALISYMSDVFRVSRGYLLVSLVATTALVWLGRFAVRRLLRSAWAAGFRLRRVLIVGANARAIQIARDVASHSGAVSDVVGLLDEYRPVGSRIQGFPVLGDPGRISGLAARLGATHIVVAPDALSWEAMRQIVTFMHRDRSTEVLLAPAVHDVQSVPVDVVHLGSTPLLAPSLTRIRGAEAAMKRALEFSFVLLALLVSLPLQIGVAVWLKLRGRPALTRESVHGLGAEVFQLPSFPVQGWLRQRHLQRLPALWLILIGRMNLIGPRPIPVSDAAAYERHQLALGTVRPGFIGPWWVVQQQRPGSPDDEIRLDLQYIRNYTIWMDVRILLRVFASLPRPRPVDGTSVRAGRASVGGES